jgi:two-component system response regulator AtoC
MNVGQSITGNLELAIVAGDEIVISALPERGVVTLGRDETCEIRIDNRSVSRRHAALHIGTKLQIEDLGSVNGTFVREDSGETTPNTVPLRRLSKETFEVQIGERINLGTVSIVVRRQKAVPEPPIIQSPAMRVLYDQLSRTARSSISALVLGETGVGKEVFARALHDRSPHASGPYLELNCAALPPSLLESELFGYDKNAFTGANQARPGLLESADGGTVFLDEVGELPAAVQVKLLRVLEDRKVMRIGGRTARKLEVRFVSATNRDLVADIERGSFRQDLYFRLNGISFVIPPLRERVEEIAPLAERFLREASRTIDRTLGLSASALGYLERYRWPGNVRELRNVIERAVVLSYGSEIEPADLPTQVTGLTATPAISRDIDLEPNGERDRIIAALEQCAGNQTRAAKLLGVSLRTLVNRLASYQLARPRKRD